MTATNRSIWMHFNYLVFPITWVQVCFVFVFVLKKIESRRRECSDKIFKCPTDWKLRSPQYFVNSINLLPGLFVQISTATATPTPATTMDNMWNLNLKTNHTVNEMKCAREKKCFHFWVCGTRAYALTRSTNTHTHTFIHSRADTPSVVCFVCTSWAWWDSWLSLFLILIWFEHVIVDAAAVAADVADPAHLCRTFICANVTDLFWAPEPDHPASHHQRKIMPTYSLVCLQDV